jgi:creatinine amidohydrolase
MGPMRSRRLADHAAPDIPSLLTDRSVLVQPVGAIEQHGPHLPLATDLVIAEAIAARVVERFGEPLDLWLLPALAYSKSNEHDWAPGTVSLSAPTMLAVLDDLGRSLARLPARRLAFLNGHGGNSALLAVANRELRVAHGLMTFLLHPSLPRDAGGGEADPDELGMGVHAGRDETSIMLHLRPDLVDMSTASRAVPEQLAANEHVTFGGSVAFGWSSDDLHASGVIGDPTLASAEHGGRLAEAMVARLGEQFAEVAAFEFPVTG